MGKIISARLATDDYDPMNLLGTTGVFSPRKYRPNKLKKKSDKINKKNIIKKNEKNID
ncbi:hypothetical protein [Candidatus Pelagibacter sp. HIMB1782]|uniref:hypothetical protein n=1 Tax=unclassified Candidatus Pelagibacter TaxID=2647897 RepID=UPI003F8480AA